MSGNEIAAEAAIRAGLHFYAGYPITPQNELSAYMSCHMPKHERTFIQAESEIAAVNMVFGAVAAGARAMTSSSSPGISLKQEGISYMAGAELPGVIINVMRGGPGLGNIAGSQSDYYQSTRGGGHGDYRTVVLAPESVQEIADHVKLSFEIADRYRNPVMIIYDGYLGQLTENAVLDEHQEMPSLDKPWALSGNKGRESRVIRSLLMAKGELEVLNAGLAEKYRQIEDNEIRYEKIMCDDAEIVMVAFGLCARQCAEAAEELRAAGIKAGIFRPVTLWPFPCRELAETCCGVKSVFVVEMNLGQMIDDVKISLAGTDTAVNFIGRTAGGVPEAEKIAEEIRKFPGGKS
ncbi:MAG: 3-methyl-2-oxobutanoate dehydrogenase subunit VorB [Planctomycetota bacterium]